MELEGKLNAVSKIEEEIRSHLLSDSNKILLVDGARQVGKTFIIRKKFSDYSDKFEYLLSAGVALGVNAIANPVFPLIQSSGKNLIKLYLNDVGILTSKLFGNNIQAVLNNEKSINLGSVYESVVGQELIAHGHKLYYYDNRSKGEVDFLIDDYSSLSVVPIEVKSGKDYTIHSALTNFVNNEDYHIKKGYVVSNKRIVKQKDKIIYIPIYYVMFINNMLDKDALII